ncbi:MAG: hypothetical protein KAQ89_00355 [Planctomycetes bacterium]|nr:hypothetical protein [Planctomycetota bacterium]
MVVTDTDWEDFDDLDSFGISICLSTGRPTAHEGRHIYETDTNKTMVYTGAAWVELAGTGGVTDHGALTGLADDDHTQYVLVNGTREMTGTLNMGANNVYLDSGILRMSDGTTLSGSIGFTTGVQNYIQRQLYSGLDYTLLSDQDYMHTWAILGAEKMHLSTADGLKLFTKINMNGLKIEGVLDPTANQEAATKKYVDDNIGASDHGALTGLADDDHTQYLLVAGTRAMTGNLQMGDNDITGADTIQATASQNLTLKVSTGSSIVFQAV